MYIPWRLRKTLSDYTPLLYHVVVNFGLKGNSEEYWDERMKETWDHPKRIWPAENRLVMSLIEKNDRILDVACGNGSILRFLNKNGFRYLSGLEISKYSIERLRNEGIFMHYGKLPKLPFVEESYDVIIASHVLEHIIRKRRFLKEILRVMTENGKAMIFVPDNCLGPIEEKEHVAVYNEVKLRKLLSKYFHVIQVKKIIDENHHSPVLFAYVEKQRSMTL